MRTEPEIFEFEPPDVDRALARMRQMAAGRIGWINFQPAVEESELKATTGIAAFFNRRSSQLTLATWTASEEVRKGIRPESIGLQHSRSHRVRAMLGDEGRTIPADWQVVQDAPRRGLVALLPEVVDHAEVLDWLISTAKIVSPVTLTGRWRAMLYWAAPEPGSTTPR